jgi:hypothetical protein
LLYFLPSYYLSVRRLLITPFDNFNLQHGFQKGLSCESQLIEFIDDVTKNLDQGKQTDIMDFSKAFDKVSHNLIIHKLKHYGITGKTNEWIKNFLSDRTQSVVVEGETSTSIPIESGVPQGSVLRPSLFLFHINDGTSKVSPEQRTRVQMNPEAQHDIKIHFYDCYQINLYVFNKFQIYFINYSGF